MRERSCRDGAPRCPTHRPRNIPPHQRAGSKFAPCRIPAVDARKVPASPDGHAPCRAAAASQRQKNKKPSRQKRICRLGKYPMQKKPPVRRYPRAGGYAPSRGKCSPSVRAQSGEKTPAQRAGARRRSPQRGSAAAGASLRQKNKKPSRQKRICRLGKCPMQKKPPSGDTPAPGDTLHPGGNAPRRSEHSLEKKRRHSEPGRGGDPRNAGAPQQARISPAKREDARRPAPCGERRTRYTTGDSDARRHTDKGV